MRLRSPLLARNILFVSRHNFPKKHSGRRNYHLMTSRPHCTSPDLMEIDSSSNDPTPSCSTFKVLSYNLWFREDVVLEERMKAVGDIIQQEAFPEFLCFQEVTHRMLFQLHQLSFFEQYCISTIPQTPYFTLLCLRKDLANSGSPEFSTYEFRGSQMGRGLDQVRCRVDGMGVVVSTTHLESPLPRDKCTQQRQDQFHESLQLLNSTQEPNLVLAGDMNWIPEDPAMDLPSDWYDAWLVANPDDPGFTYDTTRNAFLKGLRYDPSRLDRLLYKMEDFEVHWMKLLGTEAIDGVIAEVESSRGRVFQKQAFPSDHFGILAEFKRKQ